MADIVSDVAPADDKQPDYDNEKPEVAPARAALVKEWLERVSKRRKEMDETVFKQMRANQELARRGADKDWDESKYTVPITTRVINQAVARLYAKNPTAVAKRNKKMMYTLWDGKASSLQAAFQSVTMALAPQPTAASGALPAPQMPPDPMAMALIAEVQQAVQQEKMLDRMAESMELLFAYYINEQAYNYKAQIKAAVKRAKVCKVAYCKLGFQRILEPSPEQMSQIEDVTAKISTIERLLEETQKGEIDDESAKAEELRLLLQDLQANPDMIVREGFVLDFPRSTEVIIDGDCRHLKSLAGAHWLAYEYDMTPDRVMEVYKVDLKKNYKEYKAPDDKKSNEGKKVCKARIYEVWDKKNQQSFTICDGYPDFIKEPVTPDILLERFWTLYPLVFNEVEHDDQIFPQSDVENMKHLQMEYNRKKEALREHLIAARPWWASGGQFEDNEEKKISNHAAHEHVRFKALIAGQKIEDMLMAGPTAPIDPNLYETETIFVDMQRIGGFQEAQLSAAAGKTTATESSIADASRSTSDASDTDDLDEWLTEIAKSAGQIMLMEVSKDKVIEIVGPGAVWPDLPESRVEAAKDLLLEIKAGSSGRPNKAAELANIERAAPIIVQLPGINPEPLARKYFELLEIDLEDVIAEGMPSITALNAIMAKTAMGAPGQETGDASTNPASQGGAGGQNDAKPVAAQMGPQPTYQPPMAASP